MQLQVVIFDTVQDTGIALDNWIGHWQIRAVRTPKLPLPLLAIISFFASVLSGPREIACCFWNIFTPGTWLYTRQAG